MAKPTGPACNLNCDYCFYLEKEALFPEGEPYRMSDEVLEAYIRKTAEYQTVPELLYAWQGGDPTLMGVDFFRKAIELEKRYAGGRRIVNTIQTNGILTDDLGKMFGSGQQHEFGAVKEESLPRYCRECDVLFACRGECPKHRFLKTPDGEPGLNYLCAGYKKYFDHTRPYFEAIVQTIRMGYPAEKVMGLVRKGKIGSE